MLLVVLCHDALPHPKQRVEKIFRNMDRDKDAKLTYEEFVEGSKQDPTIVQVYQIDAFLPNRYLMFA